MYVYVYVYLLKLLPSFFRVENIIVYYFHHKGKTITISKNSSLFFQPPGFQYID